MKCIVCKRGDSCKTSPNSPELRVYSLATTISLSICVNFLGVMISASQVISFTGSLTFFFVIFSLLHSTHGIGVPRYRVLSEFLKSYSKRGDVASKS